MTAIVRTLLVLACCVILAMPHLAEARAGGGGSSFGSMGSRTYSVPSYNAAPIQRSVTPPPAATPQPAYNPGYNSGYAQPMGHPFLSGLAGGFLGAGLMGMLFGHGYGYGMGMSPMGTAFGGLFQLLFWGAIIYFAFRWLRHSQGGFGNFQNFGNDAPFAGLNPSINGPSVGTPVARDSPLLLTNGDTDSFRQLLVDIQNAWGAADLAHLRQFLTPEMLQYFSETLSANASKGEVNRIAAVAVTETQVLESWSEYDLDYATARMRWNAVDYMARLDLQPTDPAYVSSGDASRPVHNEEIWTFVRARSGGHWLLSAIQQIA